VTIDERAMSAEPLRVAVLQHIACEPPGAYEDVMRERNASIIRVEMDEHETLPDPGSFDAIVAMGGPMSVNDDATLPWLAEEKRFIERSVRSGRPYFGACLGVQLLAASLGGRVYPGPRPEVGLLPVVLTDEALIDPVFDGLPKEFVTLQWHGDTFDLPAGGIRLAGSSQYPNQAFKYGTVAYGVQFHLEVSPAMAAEWGLVPEYGAYLDRVLGPGSLDPLLERVAEESTTMMDRGHAMFERWFDLAESSVRATA
jgi:GMP synthase-like glutamine amidotransferase